MRGMRKKTTITVETERLLVIGRSPETTKRWCRKCNANVKVVRIDEASLITGASERTIFRLAENAEIHFIETDGGKAMFCVASLLLLRTRPARRTRPPVQNRKE